MTPPNPESGPREWWAMESHLDKGPPVIVSNERAEKYGHKDVNWHYFKVVEHSALQRAEDTILVNQGQIQSLRAQVDKAEARIAELEQNWEREHQERYRDSIAQRMRLCDKLIAAEARAKELERDIDGTNGWRDSCAFFEKRAEAAERERDLSRELFDELTIKHNLALGDLAQAERERDEQQGFAMSFQRELDAWKEIERLSGRTRQAIYGMVYQPQRPDSVGPFQPTPKESALAAQLKAGKYGDKVLEIPSCSMSPESVKIHDDICDALESRAYNEHDVCTASVGIWATLGVCEKLWRDKIDVYKNAKDENDERFMNERDTLKAKTKKIDKYLHNAEVHVKELLAGNARLTAALEHIANEKFDGQFCAQIARKALEEK